MEDYNGLGFEEESPLGFAVDTTVEDMPVFDEEPGSVSDEVDPWGEEIDHEAQDAIVKATMPPAGYYDIPKLEVSDADREAEVILETPEGLRSVRALRRRKSFYGKGYRQAEDKVYSPNIRFSISPHVGYGKDSDGNPTKDKLANDFKMFKAASKAFEQVAKRRPKNTYEVIEYLVSNPIRVRCMQGNDGLFVLDIVPARG